MHVSIAPDEGSSDKKVIDMLRYAEVPAKSLQFRTDVVLSVLQSKEDSLYKGSKGRFNYCEITR
jgi:hypothetical protein